MALRFRKSIKVAPGVKVNLGKKSAGVSVGGKGAGLSFNSKTGARARASIPGSGISYSTKLGGDNKKSSADTYTPLASTAASKAAPTPAPAYAPFPLKSRDLVVADGMLQYCKHYHLTGGASDDFSLRLFRRAQELVAPDPEVVCAFLALYDYKGLMENRGPCACVMALSRLIITGETDSTVIPVTDIQRFSLDRRSGVSVIRVIHQHGAFCLGVDSSCADAALSVCNSGLKSCLDDLAQKAAPAGADAQERSPAL